jgi:hypothetical protein
MERWDPSEKASVVQESRQRRGIGLGTASYEHGKTTGHPEDPWHSSEAASHYHSDPPDIKILFLVGLIW